MKRGGLHGITAVAELKRASPHVNAIGGVKVSTASPPWPN